tara:strand:+ start:88 stop:891 length:804 start_codon:yes stop_codon:yes gene_type:complete
MKRIYYVVVSLGEDSLIRTINSIYENCIFNFQVIVFIPYNFAYKLEKYKIHRNLSIINDEKKDGIYNSMNHVLHYLYSDVDIKQDDYLCFLNSGDLLGKDLSKKEFVSLFNNIKRNSDIYIFGHSTFIKSKFLGNLNLKNYYPPKNYTIKNVFRGGSICHQSTYIAMQFMKKNKLFFKSELTPFADLDLLLGCIRNKAVIKTFPIISTLYEGSGFSSQNILKNSIKKFLYLFRLKEFSKKYLLDLIIFFFKLIRRLINKYFVKNLIK